MSHLFGLALCEFVAFLHVACTLIPHDVLFCRKLRKGQVQNISAADSTHGHRRGIMMGRKVALKVKSTPSFCCISDPLCFRSCFRSLTRSVCLCHPLILTAGVKY